jgi:hypothetical protein
MEVRAEHEARARGAKVLFSVCDMRQAHEHHGSGFDVVISCDNSLPHLLTDDDLLVALKEMLACLSAGGGSARALCAVALCSQPAGGG